MSAVMNSPSVRLNRKTPQKGLAKGLTPSKTKVFNDVDDENFNPKTKYSSAQKLKEVVNFSPNVKSFGRQVLSSLTPNSKTPSKTKYGENLSGDVVQKLSNQLSKRLDLEPVVEKECGECAEKDTKFETLSAELINAQEV